MVSQINFAVDQDTVSVAPGANVELGVNVRNMTTLLDQVAVRVEGVEPDWFRVVPPQLPVFAQGQATARVIVQPPYDLARVRAGAYPLRVTGASQENPGQVGETVAELEIQLSGDYELTLEPLESNAEPGTFTIKVNNEANAGLQMSFTASDDEDALWYKFEPFQLNVQPGAQATTTLQVRAKQPRSNQQIVQFNIVARGEYQLQGGTRVDAPTRNLSAGYRAPAPAAMRLTIDPVLNGNDSTKSYRVKLDNPGQMPITVRLVGQAGAGNLNFEFAPQQLTVSPRSQATAMVTVRPITAVELAESFRVLALPENNQVEPVAVEATFVPQVLPKSIPLPTMPIPIQRPVRQQMQFPWAPLLSGTLGFIVTFVFVAFFAIVMGWWYP